MDSRGKFTVSGIDCLEGLIGVQSDSVDLIYLDPPFFTQRTHKLSSRKVETQYHFSDEWDSRSDYLSFMAERLKECLRVLKSTGSIFLHCDRTASHHLRLLLDNIFGEQNFQSEIIWYYRRWSNAKRGLLNSHQVIFFYSKTDRFLFNQSYTDYSPTTNVDQIFQRRVRGSNGKSEYERDEHGEVVKQDAKRGVPLSDVWEIPYLNPKAQERVGYPTQKPILLLERIIELASPPGGLVLDPFCGSGTTLIAAKLLGRSGIGFDKSHEAVKLTHSRLDNPVKSESQLLIKGKTSYLNQDKELAERLTRLGLLIVQRNKGIDAFASNESGALPIPVRVQRQKESFEDAASALIKSSIKNNYSPMILVKNNLAQSTNSLFPISFPQKDIVVLNGFPELSDFLKSLSHEAADSHRKIAF